VGTEVWVKLPYGDFVIGDTDEVVLLAGGTGISAFTAFIEGLRPEHPRTVWLVYGARDPSLLLFQEMLREQLRNVPSFQLLFFTETGGGLDSSGLPKAPECLSGRISLDLVWPRVPEPANKVFYISGPPVMLTALSGQLKARGLAPERIRTDAWE
jgi:ferredoxin-NADP reductase